MKTHLMIDIETLGTTARSVVTQIGCVLFNEKGIINSCNLGLRRGSQYNRVVSVGTLTWWGEQDEPPWVPDEEQIDLSEAYSVLKELVIQADYIWAWHPHFDIAILEDLIIGMGGEVPWSHRQIVDACSFKFLEGSPKRAKDTPHNAEADALIQAEWVIELFKNKSFTFENR